MFSEAIITNYISILVTGLILWREQLELDNNFSCRTHSWERTIRITLQLLSGCLLLLFLFGTKSRTKVDTVSKNKTRIFDGVTATCSVG